MYSVVEINFPLGSLNIVFRITITPVIGSKMTTAVSSAAEVVAEITREQSDCQETIITFAHAWLSKHILLPLLSSPTRKLQRAT